MSCCALHTATGYQALIPSLGSIVHNQGLPVMATSNQAAAANPAAANSAFSLATSKKYPQDDGAQRQNNIRQLIKNAFIYTGQHNNNEAAPVCITNGWIAIDGDTITAVGSMDDAPPAADSIVDASGSMILPGFINPHWHESFVAPNDEKPDDSHLHPTPYSNGGDIGALGGMFGFISGVAKRLTPDEALAIARWSLWTQLRSGTTTLGDLGSANTADAMAQAAIDLGMRIRVSRWSSDIMIPNEGHAAIPVANTQEQINDVQQLMDKWHNHRSGLVSAMPTVMGTFGSSDEQLIAMKTIADQYQSPYAMHLGALPNESAAIERVFGKSSIQRVADLGLLSERLMTVHTAFFNDHEYQLLQNAKVKFCYAPGHYGMLGENTLSANGHFAQRLKDGLPLASSTDGDIFYSGGMTEAMRAAHLTSNEIGNCNTVCPPTTALLTGTAYAADALDWGSRLGSIVAGKQADLVFVNKDNWRYRNSQHPLRTFLLTGSSQDIAQVMIAGQTVMQNGASPYFNEAELLDDYQRAAQSARSRIKP